MPKVIKMQRQIRRENGGKNPKITIRTGTKAMPYRGNSDAERNKTEQKKAARAGRWLSGFKKS